jgi:hypothetical protein
MQHPALVSSAARQPEKRPRPIPTLVKTAIKLMIHGGDDGVPLALIDAAKAVQLQPATLRRYFDRPSVVSLLRAERRAFIATLIAGNPAALAVIRDDREGNQMAKVRAIDALEAMGEEDPRRRSAQDSTPFMTIRIITPPAATPAPVVVEHRPIESESDDPHDSTRPLRQALFRDPTR